MHDIADLEARGVPAAFVASSEFAGAASEQSAALGLAVSVVLVPHPVQDRTDEEMRAIADAALGEVVKALTTPSAASSQAASSQAASSQATSTG